MGLLQQDGGYGSCDGETWMTRTAPLAPFPILDDAELAGKRVLDSRRSQRADGWRESDGRDAHRSHPAQSAGDRRQRARKLSSSRISAAPRAARQKYSLAPGRRRIVRAARQAGGLRRGLYRRQGAPSGRGDARRRFPLARKHPLPCRGREERAEPSSMRLPSSAMSTSTTPFHRAHRAHASTEGIGAPAAVLCRPHDAGRA